MGMQAGRRAHRGNGGGNASVAPPSRDARARVPPSCVALTARWRVGPLTAIDEDGGMPRGWQVMRDGAMDRREFGRAMVALGVGCAAPAALAAESTAAAWQQRSAVTYFVSGHSLTDDPYAHYVAQLAQGFGFTAQWNQQIGIGSPIRGRTQPVPGGGWTGYSRGKNRSGRDMDVLAEFASPRTVKGRYDTLIITETIDIVADIQFNNTVRLLRHFHERLLAAEPAGRSFFFHGWSRLPDLVDPAAWVAHERATQATWRAVAARINHSLAAEGRPDRVMDLPISGALAQLLERATSGDVAGISQPSKGATVALLFSDNVHLTRIGVYFIACATYAALYGRSPSGGWRPPEVSATQAASLQALAWDYIGNYYRSVAPMSLVEAQAHMAGDACATFWSWSGRPQNANYCRTMLSARNASNPFHYDAATDRGYWFAPP